MPKPTKGPRIGGSPAHQRIILANLATQLFEHGRITTTLTRAKRVQPLADHLITKARRGDLHALRTVGKTIKDKGVLDHLFKEIGPALAERDGGYTRITKLGPRKGDGAPMAVIEVITEKVSAKAAAKADAKAGAKPEPKKAKTAADAVVDEDIIDEAVDTVIVDDEDETDEAEESEDEAEAEDDEESSEDDDEADDDEAEDEAEDDKK